jgi:hypothetical protein
MVIDMLNFKKGGSLCENRDLDVINAIVWVLLCKIIKV